MDTLKDFLAEGTILFQSESIFVKLAIAIILLFIGWNVLNLFTKLFDKALAKRNFDETLKPFVISLVAVSSRAFLFITIASYLGVETTSFVAVLGAVSFAIGLALQGALANFAGGVLILVTRPYKVGDLVEIQSELGVVKEIQVFNTVLLSPENKTIILPNGAVSNGNITNYTVEGLIRVDLSVGISYDSDIKKAKEIVSKLMEQNENVLKDPAPFVGVSELADSSINLAVRPYSHPSKYWDVFFDLNEDIKNAFDEGGINIPYPHVQVISK